MAHAGPALLAEVESKRGLTLIVPHKLGSLLLWKVRRTAGDHNHHPEHLPAARKAERTHHSA